MSENKLATDFIDVWCAKHSKNPEFAETPVYYKGLANQMKKMIQSGATILELEQVRKAGPGAYKNEFGQLECSNKSFRFICQMAMKALKHQQVEESKQQSRRVSLWVRAQRFCSFR